MNALLQRLKLGLLKPYNKAFGAHYGIWSEKRLVRYMSTSVGHVNDNPFKPLISIDYLASMPGVHGGSRAFDALNTVVGATLFTQALITDQAQAFWMSKVMKSGLATACVGLFYIATMDDDKNVYTVFDDVTFMSSRPNPKPKQR